MAKADLHLHSDYSDGSDTVRELIRKIEEAGITIFALTDHDEISGCCEAADYVPENIKFIPGIELTCRTGDIKCHILGLNCNPYNETLLRLIEKGKVLRRIKLDTRVEYLKTKWGIVLTTEEKDWLYSRKSPVKTHFANILVNRGLAESNLPAMKKYLDGCTAGDTKFDVKEAIEAVTASGGIPVWAHPLGGEGEEHDDVGTFYEKLKVMKSLGIKGLECYYSRYSSKEIDFLVSAAKENNLLISGGSDYHGKNKDIPLFKLSSDNVYVDSSLLNVLGQIF